MDIGRRQVRGCRTEPICNCNGEKEYSGWETQTRCTICENLVCENFRGILWRKYGGVPAYL
ncbi:proline-rich receptor-like protein kinase PERK2 [Iris pallida]|uniref:Proline-rich receptor-like protein kinase PERK2 n=1 Tax=Iris pallida TaxID=29817 RepID=A0AAX6FME6_IRIPA|nr:proline-rich receptor-like protein kinase PERK2 [Iris pallida]